jgi:hypothetical protein
MDHPEEETKPDPPAFDFDAFPVDTLFYDRREGRERRRRSPTDQARPAPAPKPAPERRARKARRRRIDPTTFEKQYTDDEMEFMNAMQRFKVQMGKTFPSHRDVLHVAVSIGYRKTVEGDFDGYPEDDSLAVIPATNGHHAEE